jgi:exonuclease 3'-5' domain-containing protein 1
MKEINKLRLNDEQSKYTKKQTNVPGIFIQSIAIAMRLSTGLGFEVVLVDDEQKLEDMLDSIGVPERVNVDFEGVELCKTGRVCLGQVHVAETDVVYVVDFVTITNPFTACGGRLKELFESSATLKVFFDPRNDIDGIANQYGVTKTRNIVCLQLAEVAYRKSRGEQTTFVHGLGRVMDSNLVLPYVKKTKAIEIKEAGRRLFAPERGGAYDIFEERPLREDLLLYSGADVYFFDNLYEMMFQRLPSGLQTKVINASTRRLTEYLKPGYCAKGREKAIAPSLF